MPKYKQYLVRATEVLEKKCGRWEALQNRFQLPKHGATLQLTLVKRGEGVGLALR